MTELDQAEKRLAEKTALFEPEEQELKRRVDEAVRQLDNARSIFQSFAQQRRDQLKPFRDVVASATQKPRLEE